MKKIKLVAFFLISLAFVNISNTEAIPGSQNKPKLIWSDEFNGSGLPDSTKWGYEVGFVRNNEKQFYTYKRTQNVRQEDGCLEIESLREKFQGADYTSASINTLGKKSFNGDIRIEVRAKLPGGKGIWPAIWMMGDNLNKVGWPKCSELDIMEFVGHTPGKVFGTLHWWDSTSTKEYNHMMKGSNLVIDSLQTKFHLYALERKGNTISLFVDGQNYLIFSPPPTAFEKSFNGPLFLLLNTAIGGSWGGDIDDTIFPQKFFIDFVRVYRID